MDDTLCHFDSDESCESDFIDDEEEEEEPTYTPMFLPVDAMKEIMYYCDMHTYIKLHCINKTLKIACDNDLWKRKMETYCCTNDERWIHLNKHDLISHVKNHGQCYNIIIKIEKTISVDNYKLFINNIADEFYVKIDGNAGLLIFTIHNVVHSSKYLLDALTSSLKFTERNKLVFRCFELWVFR